MSRAARVSRQAKLLLSQPPPSPGVSSTPFARAAFLAALEDSTKPLPQLEFEAYTRIQEERQAQEAETQRRRAEHRQKSLIKEGQALKGLLFDSPEIQRGYALNPRGLHPGVECYQHLAPSEERLASAAVHSTAGIGLVSRLKCLIPDTIVQTPSGRFLLYTDEAGYITRMTNFTAQHALARMTHDVPLVTPPLSPVDGVPLPLDRAQRRAASYIAAVLKTPGSQMGLTECALLTTKDTATLIESKLGANSSSTPSQTFALQRFIRPHGGRKVCLYRCVWRPGHSLVKGVGCTYVLTNQLDMESVSGGDGADNAASWLLIQPGVPSHARNIIVVKQQGKPCEEMLTLTGTVALHLARTLTLTFTELVCDFLRDPHGRPVLLQIKSFRLRDDGVPREIVQHTKGLIAKRPASTVAQANKTSRCASCKRFLSNSALQYRMTEVQLAELRRHLETHGRSPAAAILRDMMTRGHTFGRDSSSTAHDKEGLVASRKDPGPFPACVECAKLVREIGRLRKVAREYARAMGIPEFKAIKGSMQGDLEAEDGYRMQESTGGASARGEVRSRAATATSILTHSNVIPTTKSTLITADQVLSPVNATDTSDPSIIAPSSSSHPILPLEPELRLHNTPTPFGPLSVKLEHLEVAPSTILPPSMYAGYSSMLIGSPAYRESWSGTGRREGWKEGGWSGMSRGGRREWSSTRRRGGGCA